MFLLQPIDFCEYKILWRQNKQHFEEYALKLKDEAF